LGTCTKNKAKLIALKLVFMMALENIIQKLQIMGDFMLVIEWTKKERAL